MNRLFGTDGVRGVANEFLTPELAFALGRAGGSILARRGLRRPVLVGRDTRLSGPMLEAGLCAGIASIGLDAWKLGIVTTPAVAFLTRRLGAAAGVMISASHNPVEDNGIKFFASDGCKLADSLEDEIAALVDAHKDLPRPTGASVGEILERRRVVRSYVQHLRDLAPDGLIGMGVVVDAAYGAAYDIAPKLFADLGASVVPLHCMPNGAKINVECGSTHLGPLRQAVKARPGYVGVAFDGDADRALFIDENGDDVTGDHVLAIFARELRSAGALPGNSVVATVMSNVGLEIALRDADIRLERTAVGDRYVLEAMQRGKFRLGGEQSGHIIDLEANTTGDGLVTAVRLLSIARRRGGLADVASCLQLFPQVLVNVRVADRERVNDPRVRASIVEIEKKLNGNGRVLVRASGTEPVIRIMIEGQNETDIRAYASHIAENVTQASADERSSKPM